MSNTISQFPNLSSSEDTIYIPVIKKGSGTDYINYKATCDDIIQNGQVTLNMLIQAYLALNSIKAVDTSKYYTKEEVDALIKKALNAD